MNNESEYQLITDSSCDLSSDYLASQDIISLQLSFSINNKEYLCNEMEKKEFYHKMRDGALPKTSQVGVNQILSTFESVLQKGKNILYIAFSSGMSGTYSSSCIVAEELLAKYPDRRIHVVDSLSVTLGEGILVYLANMMKKAGNSLESVADWVKQNVLKMSHFVTAGDLSHLHRGGRISAAQKIVGTLLKMQPVLHINNQGEAKMIATKRGRKNTLDFLVHQVGTVVTDFRDAICGISHTDCEQDALYVRDRLVEKYEIEKFLIEEAGPVLGAHTGPDAVAVCILGNHR